MRVEVFVWKYSVQESVWVCVNVCERDDGFVSVRTCVAVSVGEQD